MPAPRAIGCPGALGTVPLVGRRAVGWPRSGGVAGHGPGQLGDSRGATGVTAQSAGAHGVAGGVGHGASARGPVPERAPAEPEPRSAVPGAEPSNTAPATGSLGRPPP